MKKLFQRWVLSRLWLTFIVLGLSFSLFVAGTLNMGLLFMSNTAYITETGWVAEMEGGLPQLV